MTHARDTQWRSHLIAGVAATLSLGHAKVYAYDIAERCVMYARNAQMGNFHVADNPDRVINNSLMSRATHCVYS